MTDIRWSYLKVDGNLTGMVEGVMVEPGVYFYEIPAIDGSIITLSDEPN